MPFIGYVLRGDMQLEGNLFTIDHRLKFVKRQRPVCGLKAAYGTQDTLAKNVEFACLETCTKPNLRIFNSASCTNSICHPLSMGTTNAYSIPHKNTRASLLFRGAENPVL